MMFSSSKSLRPVQPGLHGLVCLFSNSDLQNQMQFLKRQEYLQCYLHRLQEFRCRIKIPDIRPSESPSETTIAASQPWKAGVIKLSDKVPRRADPPSVQSKNNDAFFLCSGNQSVSTCKLLVSIDTGSTKSLGRSTDCKDQSFAVIWKICACDVLIHCYFNASLCAKCICNVYISTLSNTGQIAME